jgi:hypothetical protein
VSYFAPNLVPGHYMIDALITPEDFYAAIKKLPPRLALHLLFVDRNNSVIVAPLHCLASVEKAHVEAKKANQPNAEYLAKLTEEWISLINSGASKHPQRKKLLAGIQTALSGDLAPPPAWTRYFDISLATGNDNTIHLPSNLTLTRELGASSEPAADLRQVLAALGYGKATKINPGRKPK